MKKYTDILYVQAGGGVAILVRFDTRTSLGACEGREMPVDEHSAMPEQTCCCSPAALRFGEEEQRGKVSEAEMKGTHGSGKEHTLWRVLAGLERVVSTVSM